MISKSKKEEIALFLVSSVIFGIFFLSINYLIEMKLVAPPIYLIATVRIISFVLSAICTTGIIIFGIFLFSYLNNFYRNVIMDEDTTKNKLVPPTNPDNYPKE